MNKAIFFVGLVSILVFGGIKPVLAMPPNVLGTYVGRFNEAGFGVVQPNSGTITIVIDQQNGANFSGTVNFREDGDTAEPDRELSGTVDAAGQTSGTYVTVGIGPVPNYTGTFSGDQLTFFFGGSVNGTATLTRTSAQQDEAAGQSFAVAGGTSAAIFNAIAGIGNHMGTLHDGSNEGMNVEGLKVNIDGNTVSLGDLQKWLGLQQGGGAGDGSSIFGDRVGVFAIGNFSFGDHDRTGRESGYDFNVLGTTVGADYRLTDRLFLGAAFGYAGTNTNFDRSGGGVDADGYSVTLYSSYNQPGSFFLDGLLRYGWSDYELDRNFLGQKAKADYDGIDYSASLSGGYEWVFKGVSIQPFARFDYVAVDIDKYSEKAKSAGAAGGLLVVNQQSLQSLRTALGGQASYVVSTGFGVFVPTARVEWLHEYKDNSRTIRSSLINNPTATTAFRSDSPDRNFLNLGAGVTAVFAHGFSGFVNYEALLANQYLSQHTVNLGMRMDF